MTEIETAFDRLANVAAHDGTPLVESKGVAVDLAAGRRKLLRRIEEDLVVWERIARRSHSSGVRMVHTRGGPQDETEPEDAEAEDDASDGMDEGEMAAE